VSIAIAEQFSLFDIPASEPKRVRTKWQELKEMREQADEHGGLVPPLVAACLLDVSKQRVNDMINSGILHRYEWFGKPFISVKEVAAYVNSERRTGRPARNPPSTLKETHQRVAKLRKEKR